MKKQIVFLVLLSLANLCSGMEEPPEKRQRVEALSPLEAIPPEIKALIITALAQSGTLLEAVQSINSLSLVNREFYILINDQLITKDIIVQLVEKFDKEIIKKLEELTLPPDPLLKKIYTLALLATPGAMVMLNAEIGSKTKVQVEAEKLLLGLAKKETITNLMLIHSLLKTDINVNVQDELDESKRTALMLAASYGHKGIVDALLNHKDIDVNAKGEKGYTALIWAVSLDNKEIVELLLNHLNIDVNIKDNDDNTALDLTWDDSIIKLLEAKGAKEGSELD